MAQTLSEQILSHAAGHTVRAGELAVVELGRVMTIDSLAPEVIDVLEDSLGVERIPYPERCAIFVDHVAPASNVATAEGQARTRRFAREQGIEHLYDSGCGICHQLMVEEHLVAPGMVAIGSDSHSTTYGAVAAFGTGMGTTDIALAFATGRTWMRARTARRFCPGNCCSSNCAARWTACAGGAPLSLSSWALPGVPGGRSAGGRRA